MAKYDLLLCINGYQSDVISFAMTNKDQENMQWLFWGHISNLSKGKLWIDALNMR
jgi:hypothetical protein